MREKRREEWMNDEGKRGSGEGGRERKGLMMMKGKEKTKKEVRGSREGWRRRREEMEEDEGIKELRKIR